MEQAKKIAKPKFQLTFSLSSFILLAATFRYVFRLRGSRSQKTSRHLKFLLAHTNEHGLHFISFVSRVKYGWKYINTGHISTEMFP